MDLKREKPNIGRTAIIAAIVAILALLPALIIGRGMLLFSDDFTYQQQIFNIYYGELYKSGNLFGYSWYTDLGSGVVSSYSFYNLFSPFTLLFAFFPANVIPYLTAPMLVLKYVTAAVLAYIYIQKFAKNSRAATFGALLYAFSGLQTINLIFPFHDMTALFPLLLIGVEEATAENRERWQGTGILAIAVALSALTNYYLFFGEVIFAIIYFLFRFKLSKNIKGMLRCLLGGLLGAMTAAIILVPSALSVLENPRLSDTSWSLLFGWDGYLTLLQAYFMPVSVMGTRNAFLQHTCSSCSIWLPFVGMSLCFAFAAESFRKKDKTGMRITYLMLACVIISALPILNSVFSLFNANYYARWFYMPSLIFALASSLILSDERTLRKPLKEGAIANLAFTIFTAILSLAAYFVFKIFGKTYITKQVNLPLLIAYFAAGIFCAAAVFFVIRSSRRVVKALTVYAAISAIIITGLAGVRYSCGTSPKEHYEKGIVNTEGQIGASEAKKILSLKSLGNLAENFRVRTDFHDAGSTYFANSYDNVSLLTDTMSVNSFISTVSGGIFELYEGLGIDRKVTTVGDFSDGLMLLLSCRYRLTESGELSEYEYYLPLGFSYNKYITRDEFLALPTEERTTAMLNFIITDEKTSLEHGDIADMSHDLKALSNRDVCTNFERNAKGFSAEFSSEADCMVFFSVPYESGFTAYVNGEKTEIIDSNGLMAISVKAGTNTIVFRYVTPGLTTGIILGIIGLLGTCVLFIVNKNYLKRKFNT